MPNIELLRKTNFEKISTLSLISPVYHFLDKLFCYLNYGFKTLYFILKIIALKTGSVMSEHIAGQSFAHI